MIVNQTKSYDYTLPGWQDAPTLCSPPRNCSHEALPFVEAAAKAKLAGSIKA
jgi:hypothetical protein